MSGKKILVVEDDNHIGKLLKYTIEKEGFDCTLVVSGEDALRELEHRRADAIILDVMLPNMDGREVCRTVKRHVSWATIPIIMLTAKGEEVDRIVGFELGADDYVVKPFSPRELMLRIKAVLKRGTEAEPVESITFQHLTIDTTRHKVMVKTKEIELTPMEFKLLLTLIQRKGRVQSRERLLDDVWGIEAAVTTRTVDTHVKRLRQKLGTMGHAIETVRGVGYRFMDEAG